MLRSLDRRSGRRMNARRRRPQAREEKERGGGGGGGWRPSVRPPVGPRLRWIGARLARYFRTSEPERPWLASAGRESEGTSHPDRSKRKKERSGERKERLKPPPLPSMTGGGGGRGGHGGLVGARRSLLHSALLARSLGLGLGGIDLPSRRILSREARSVRIS